MFMLAQANPFESVGRYLHSWNPGLDLVHLAVISGAAVLIWAGVTWFEQARLQHQQNASTPRALFALLCRAHHLGRNERRMLAQAVANEPAANRCDVFINPGILKSLAQGGGPDAAAYSGLLHRLFESN
jgi:hypothetical protein